jgi:very-short-patch-repair endonuclease
VRTPEPLPDPLNGRAFSVSEALRLGVPEKRLRSRDLSSPYPGVRRVGALGASASTTDRAVAYAPRLAADQYFSHLTAAELLGMRVPSRGRNGPLHVTSVQPRRAPRLKGVVGHEVKVAPPLLRWQASPLVVSDHVATWLTLAEGLPLDDLVVMGDGLISRRDPAASLQSLEGRVSDGTIRRGSSQLRAALRQMRAGTDSAPETALRLLLVRSGLPEPEVNGLVETGHRSYHGDLVFRAQRVVVEYDGGHHRTDETQFSIDVDRLDRIMEAGWRVVRVDRRLLRQRGELIRRVTAAVTGLDLQEPPL